VGESWPDQPILHTLTPESGIFPPIL